MKAKDQIDSDLAKMTGNRLKIDFVAFDLEKFTEALNMELEIEIKEGVVDPNDDLSLKDFEGIGRVILSHMVTRSKY